MFLFNRSNQESVRNSIQQPQRDKNIPRSSRPREIRLEGPKISRHPRPVGGCRHKRSPNPLPFTESVSKSPTLTAIDCHPRSTPVEHSRLLRKGIVWAGTRLRFQGRRAADRSIKTTENSAGEDPHARTMDLRRADQQEDDGFRG